MIADVVVNDYLVQFACVVFAGLCVMTAIVCGAVVKVKKAKLRAARPDANGDDE